MIVAADNPIMVNGREVTEYDGAVPITITGDATVRITSDRERGRKTKPVFSKLEDAQEHKIPPGGTVIVTLNNRELQVYER